MQTDVLAMAAFTLPFTAINTGVMANSIVVPMTTFTIVTRNAVPKAMREPFNAASWI